MIVGFPFRFPYGSINFPIGNQSCLYNTILCYGFLGSKKNDNLPDTPGVTAPGVVPTEFRVLDSGIYCEKNYPTFEGLADENTIFE